MHARALYSRFIWSVTSALEAWVMLELEARQVKAVSTFLRCTVPTISEDDTTVVAASSRRWSTVRTLLSDDTDTAIPLISQCSAGAGRPERKEEMGDQRSPLIIMGGPSTRGKAYVYKRFKCPNTNTTLMFGVSQ